MKTIVTIAWLTNLVVGTGLWFGYAYTGHYGHWAFAACKGLLVSSVCMKVMLTLTLIWVYAGSHLRSEDI